jgi:hypothetical protein
MTGDNWPDMLIAAVERHRVLPLVYGKSDCWTMAADVIEALTGERPYPDVMYRSKAGAAKALAQRGFASVADALAARLPETPVAMAGRGDIGIVDTPDGLAAAVCVGPWFVVKAETGIDHVSRDRIVRAFKVR